MGFKDRPDAVGRRYPLKGTGERIDFEPVQPRSGKGGKKGR